MICSSASLIDDAGFAVSMRCRRWQCDTCAPINRMMLACRIRDGRPDTVITLTANPHWFATPHERAAHLVRAWTLIRRRTKRMGMLMPFLAVFEETSRGEPHLHIAVRGPVPSKCWLSAAMGKLNGAHVVKIQRVTDLRGLAAYMSKAPFMFSGRRRFWTSRLWPKLKPAWRAASFNLGCVVPLTIERLQLAFEQANIPCRRMSRHRLSFDPP